MKTADVLWTGGKDSCYAAMLAISEGWTLRRLVLFVPEGEVKFQAHPVELIQAQAEAMSLPLCLIPIKDPYRQSYVKAILQMTGIDALITGDIDLVDGYPNWIEECVAEAKSPLQVLKPLWKRDRSELLREMLAAGMQIVITHIACPHLPPEWKGRLIDSTMADKLDELSRTKDVDVCGENGEYHTMVLNCPLFSKPISLDAKP